MGDPGVNVAAAKGRPKGTKVVMCPCGWRVTGKGKSATCVGCGQRVHLDKKRPRTKNFA